MATRGNWWTSCQYSATNAVNLNNGGFNNNNKTNSNTVLRVFEHYIGMQTNWLSLDELYDAYLDCRQNKRRSNSCARFEQHEASELVSLWEDLNDLTYSIGRSDVFCVTRPKLREIFAANFRDRIVHHLIMRRLMPLFERYFIQDTYNCRKGKGTDYGIMRFNEAMNEYADGWVLVCDIKGFFMSIDREKLWNMLNRFITDNYQGEHKEHILWLVKMIVLNEPEKNSRRKGDFTLWNNLDADKSLFTNKPGHGLPIGNLTSQIFGNFFLSPFDKMMVTETEGKARYGRYVDDFYVVSNDKEFLLSLIGTARTFLANELGLRLHPHKVYLQPVRHGCKFIGTVIKQGRKYVGNRTVNHFDTMLHQHGDTLERFICRYNSYNGFMLRKNTYAIRCNMFKQIRPEYKEKIEMVGDMHHIRKKKNKQKQKKTKLLHQYTKNGQLIAEWKNI